MTGHALKAKRRPRVLFANKFVPHYRRAFYEGLRARLELDGVDLDLVYGNPVGDDAKKSDSIALKWALYRPNIRVGTRSKHLIFQPIVRLAATYDLVVIEQANKLLVNPILLLMNRLRITRVAFWGHGKDFQQESHPVMQWFKRSLVPLVHWWFAYNDLSAAAVRDAGFPEDRITSFMNTIDSGMLRKDLESITSFDLEKKRSEFGLRGQNICIYIGGMYDLKRLPFLFEACDLVREAIPDFEMIFLGSGSDRDLVDAFCADRAWAFSLGPMFGSEKAVFLRLAKLFLMPGLVGLALIDTFTAQVPIVTTRVSFHSPEIDYLMNGVNGISVEATDAPDLYAAEIVRLLSDLDALRRLQLGCSESASKYTMPLMVDRVADGIIGALDLIR